MIKFIVGYTIYRWFVFDYFFYDNRPCMAVTNFKDGFTKIRILVYFFQQVITGGIWQV